MIKKSIIRPLLGRWQLTTHDIVPVAAWQTEPSSILVENKEPVFMYSCVASKHLMMSLMGFEECCI